MTRRAGWTLVEMAVVTLLLTLVILVISQTLLSTMRAATLETERNVAQGNAQAIVAQVGSSLQHSTVAGQAWLPPAPGLAATLAIHELKEGPFPASTRWKTTWKCFCWQPVSGKFYRVQCPPGPNMVAPPDAQAQAMAVTELKLVAQAMPPGATLLSGVVRDFRYRTLAGPLAQVVLEVQIQAAHGRETFRLEREFFLRNHE